MRLINNTFYERCRWYDNNGIQREKSINLATNNEDIAMIRAKLIHPLKSEISQGKEFSFPWEIDNNHGTTMYKQYNVENTIEKYLSFRKTDQVFPLRTKTYKLYVDRLSGFKKYFLSRDIRSISMKNINQFINYEIDRKISFNTINITIRTLNCFLRWCYKERYISNVLKIPTLRVPKQLPQYISDVNFNKIMSALKNPEFKDFFEMYRNTGMRLSEPYLGIIDENFLVLSSRLSKTGKARDIPLTDNDVRIINKLKSSGISSKRLSVIFKEAAKKAKVNTKFHAIRHTFAVKKYLASGNIYLVKELLGHNSITTTEIYANFNLRKLIQDFPGIKTELIG